MNDNKHLDDFQTSRKLLITSCTSNTCMIFVCQCRWWL